MVLRAQRWCPQVSGQSHPINQAQNLDESGSLRSGEATTVSVFDQTVFSPIWEALSQAIVCLHF